MGIKRRNNMRYLIVMEDGEFFQTNNITPNDTNAIQKGHVRIVDANTMVEICDDLSWDPIQRWEYEEEK